MSIYLRTFKRAASLFLFTAAILMFSGCSGSGTEFTGNGTGSLVLNLPGQGEDNKAIPGDTTTIEITIEGENLGSPVLTTVPALSGSVVIDEIPKGMKTATIRGKNSTNQVTAQNKTVFEINSGQTTDSGNIYLGIVITGPGSNPVFEPSELTVRHDETFIIQNWTDAQAAVSGFEGGNIVLDAAGEYEYPSTEKSAVSPVELTLNGQPAGAVEISDYRLLYLANHNSTPNSDTVPKIRWYHDNKFVHEKTISTGAERLYTLAFNPYNGLIYTGGQANVIKYFNRQTDAAAGTITTQTLPRGAVVSNDGSFIYFMNAVSDSITVVDSSDNSIITTISGLDHPHNGCFSHDGTKFYTSNYYGDNIAVINSVNHTNPETTIAVGNKPVCCIIHPTQNKVYAASENAIYVINTDTDTVERTYSATGHNYGLAITPDEQYLYATLWNGTTMNKVRLSDHTVFENAVTGLDSAGLVDITDDGNFIAAPNYGNSTVSIIDTSTDTVIKTLSGMDIELPVNNIIVEPQN